MCCNGVDETGEKLFQPLYETGVRASKQCGVCSGECVLYAL
jgi:hypothetical protein